MVTRPDRKPAYSIKDIAARRPQSKHVREVIRDLVLNGAYDEMEYLLMGVDATGSRQFDEAYAVQILLKHDEMGDNFLNDTLDNTNMNHRMLWNRLYSVLDGIGFEMRQGRLVGVKALEDNSSVPEAGAILDPA